jgi:xylan 1,4-beta-xylosidase
MSSSSPRQVSVVGLCFFACSLLNAQKDISATVATSIPASSTPATDGTIRLDADASATGKPLVHYWSKVVGAGRANEGLRATWQEQLHDSVEFGGFQYVRFHGLFHDDMFMYHLDKQGQPIYNFQYLDDLFDRMLANGAKPFVELGFVPNEMASDTSTSMWWKAHGTPPKDNAKWAELVDHFVRHCIARYGAAEVRSWYFEVWNEPNLHSFFSGTQAQYFELYKVSALTIKKIDPALRVGGPATSNFQLVESKEPGAKKATVNAEGEGGNWRPVWVEDFLAYCASNHLPLDFISTHPYPTNFAMEIDGATKKLRRSVNSTHGDLLTLRKIVDASAYPHAELQLTEWSSSPFSRDHTHDALPPAAFLLKANLDSIGLVDSLSYWVFTDVLEESRDIDSVFHGGFGLINYQGIVKPAFHAYRFLNQLGDQTLASSDGAFVTRHSGTGKISAVVYNYPQEMKVTIPVTLTVEEADQLTAVGTARPLHLHLKGLVPGTPFLIETVDKTHANPVSSWEQMGSPETPSREQTEMLKRMAWETAKKILRVDASGNLNIDTTLDPWSIALIQQLD